MSALALRLRSAALSDVGRVRHANEDSFIERPDMGLWLVADGMGGHAHGQWASHTIVEAIEALAPSGDFDADIRAVADAIHHANSVIHQRSEEDGVAVGSTAVALLVQDGRFAVLWAGDSRAYLCRGGDLVQLTHDHTHVQTMVDAGLLAADEARRHPMGHVVERAVGVEPTLEIDGVVDAVEVGDAFLVCSDGLTDVVSDAEIAAAMVARQPQLALEALVALCLERGAPDNVTAIAVTCEEITRLSLAEAEG